MSFIGFIGIVPLIGCKTVCNGPRPPSSAFWNPIQAELYLDRYRLILHGAQKNPNNTTKRVADGNFMLVGLRLPTDSAFKTWILAIMVIPEISK